MTRAERMGYGVATKQAPKAAATPVPRDIASKRMYPSKPGEAGGTFDRYVGGYYARRRGGLRARNDWGEIDRSWVEQRQVEEFCRKWGITPEDAGTVLGRLLEHEERPRSQEAIKARMPRMLESLRIKLGSEEALKKTVEACLRVTTDLAATIPALNARAVSTGAGEDGVLIETLAKYGERTEPPPAAA